MKFIRYSKFKGFDVSGVNLGDLMNGLQDSLLQSGYDDDYYWTRQRTTAGHFARCAAASLASGSR